MTFGCVACIILKMEGKMGTPKLNDILLATNPVFVGVLMLAAYYFFTLPHFLLATFVFWWYTVAWMTVVACFWTPRPKR